MFKRRSPAPADDPAFRRACNVYVEADGERAIVVSCFNHAGLTAEIPGTATVFDTADRQEVGRIVLEALSGCVWQPEFDYSQSKRSDWPAFQASGERSIKAFEQQWNPVDVGASNDTNASWTIEARTSFDFSLRLTASVAPATDADRLGAALLYVVDKLGSLT